MFRRIPVLVLSLAGALALAFPAYARSHVVAQTSTVKGSHTAFLTWALQAGHRYHVQVTARGHYKFSGFGTETLTYIDNHHLGTTNKSLRFSGKTPKSFLVTQPPAKGVSSWSLAVSIDAQTLQRVTVRFVDLGK